MWWLSQSTRRLEAKWELSASEKHVPTSCLSDALRGIHALNSDVLPGASTALTPALLHPKRQHRVFKIPRWGGWSCRLCQWGKQVHPTAVNLNNFEMQTTSVNLCGDRNLSKQFKEDPYKTECLAALARSLQYADCAVIQLKDFWQNTTYAACSYPNRSSRWISTCYWEPL